MKLATYEAVVENGQIKLSDAVQLPEHAKVYVVVTSDEEAPRFRVGSPRLARPGDVNDFAKVVSEEVPDAGL